MKNKIFLILSILFLLCSCTQEKIWEVSIGESRKSVASHLRQQGYEIEDFPSSDSYLTVKDKVQFYGITWNEATCWFDDGNRLRGIEFAKYTIPPIDKIENLGKYLKEDGYTALDEAEKDNGIITIDKGNVTAVITVPKYGPFTLSFWKDYRKK